MASIDQPAPSLSPASPLVAFNFRIPILVPIFAVALIIRLLLASLPGFDIDLGTFRAWSERLANGNPWNFYQPGEFTDYAPGYMYVLWLIGELNEVFHFNQDQWEYILKIPAIVADLASTYLVYRMLDKQSPTTQLSATIIYAFFPPALLVGAFWGQVDSILAFFLLLTVYFLSKERPLAAAVAYTVGFLVKPQSIAALPFLAFWILRTYAPKFSGIVPQEVPWTWIKCTLVPLAVLLVLITPFFEYQPWKFIDVLSDSANVCSYKVNSFWAYNFWNTGGIFQMGFKPDVSTACSGDQVIGTTFLGLETRYWGWLLFASAIGTILFLFRHARSPGLLALGTALSMMAFYLFLTRMHERYVFGAFLPLLVACALLHSRILWGLFVATAAIHFINLYHVFGWYYLFNDSQENRYPAFLRWDHFFDWLERPHNIPILSRFSFIGAPEALQIFSVMFVTAFVGFLVYAFYMNLERPPPPEAT
jgi:Gpi18-like mannosyltransferase